jgi:hypothetical protein
MARCCGTGGPFGIRRRVWRPCGSGAPCMPTVPLAAQARSRRACGPATIGGPPSRAIDPEHVPAQVYPCGVADRTRNGSGRGPPIELTPGAPKGRKHAPPDARACRRGAGRSGARSGSGAGAEGRADAPHRDPRRRQRSRTRPVLAPASQLRAVVGQRRPCRGPDDPDRAPLRRRQPRAPARTGRRAAETRRRRCRSSPCSSTSR